MSVPFRPPQTWRDRVRTPAQLLGLLLLIHSCNLGVDAWQSAALRRHAAPYLEAANHQRRQLGLFPVTAALRQPTYQGLQNRDSLEQVYYQSESAACLPGRVCHSVKMVRLETATGKWWEEADHFVFTDRVSQPDSARAYYLECTYSFAPKPGTQPWRIRLSVSRYSTKDSTGISGYTLTLARAQVDSVLRSWRQLSWQDSLARVAHLAK